MSSLASSCPVGVLGRGIPNRPPDKASNLGVEVASSQLIDVDVINLISSIDGGGASDRNGEKGAVPPVASLAPL